MTPLAGKLGAEVAQIKENPMAVAPASTSFSRFGDELESAISWAKGLGLSLDRGRFQDYARTVEHGMTGEGKAGNDEFAFALTAVEAGQELILISKALEGIPPDVLRERLARYITGTTLERDESAKSGSSAPRNFGFELLIAATLRNGKLSATFPIVGDVEVRPSPKINIECKRPQGLAGVKNLVKKAGDQLQRRGENETGQRPTGVIALSVGKILHSGEKYLSAPSEQDGLKELERMATKFVNENEEIWQERSMPFVHAVLVDVSSVIHVPDQNAWLWGRYQIINPKEDTKKETAMSDLTTMAAATKAQCAPQYF